MKFVLWEKLAGLEGQELWLLIAAAVVCVGLIIAFAAFGRRRTREAPASAKRLSTRVLAQGALCVAMAFVLSYIKLFSMPLGGSVTLFSMLPIVLFAWLYGPAAGFTAAFAYSLLQVAQGAYIVHWAQFILDYFVAFTVLGVAGFFKRSLPLGMAVAGVCRLACSVLSGVIFFASSAAEAGYASALWYSLLYNGSTIGVDTLLCVAAALIPAVRRAALRIKEGR